MVVYTKRLSTIMVLSQILIEGESKVQEVDIQDAMELHRRAIVIDAHSDILTAVADGRVRLGEHTVVNSITTRDVRGHYDLPRWLEGGVTAQVCALFISTDHLHHPLDRALQMVVSLLEEIAANDRLTLATTVEDIQNAKRDGRVAIIFSLEGMDPLGGNLIYLRLLHLIGVRMASLTHARRNYFAGGVIRGITDDVGLTPLGVDAVKLMNELGIVIDLRHLDVKSFWQILEITTAPVVISHVNARQAFPVDPNDGPHFPFTCRSGLDGSAMLHALAENGAVLGIIFWSQESIDAVVADIDYVVQSIGPRHVGLGSDFFGFDRAPLGAEDVSKFPAVTERLLKLGYPHEAVLDILGGNFLRLFGQVWGSAKK